MRYEEIGAVRFGVFVQGRGLQDWEWQSIELLRAAGATCLFILVPPHAGARRPSAARALEGLVLRIAGLPAWSGLEDFQRYQPSTMCAVERAAACGAALDAAQRRELSERRLKFVLFFGAGEAPKGLAGCAELGVWQFTRSAGAAGEYPFIHGVSRREDVVSFGLEQITGHENRPRLRCV